MLTRFLTSTSVFQHLKHNKFQSVNNKVSVSTRLVVLLVFTIELVIHRNLIHHIILVKFKRKCALIFQESDLKSPEFSSFTLE